MSLRRPISLAGCLVAVSSQVAAAAPQDCFRGGLEHYCFDGQPMVEQWDLTDPDDRRWSLLEMDGRYLPYFPRATCFTGIFEESPGAKSVVQAAAAWTDPVPGSDVSAWSFPGHDQSVNSETPFPAPQDSVLSTIDPNAFGNDYNIISFWEPQSTFNLFGGDLTVGVGSVERDDVTGWIVECDMVFPAQSVDEFDTPLWAFTESGVDLYSTALQVVPVLGYVDIQGVVTHEFGHFAGLGHSLIDSTSTPAGSDFPTMFPRACVESFDGFYVATPTTQGGCVYENVHMVAGSQTKLGGIVGRSARTLEQDDIAAICGAYPGPDLGTTFGSIRGEIEVHPVADPAVGVGAHVVALGVNDPENLRIGTIAKTSSSQCPYEFELEGLPPGDYYVFIEEVFDDPYFPPSDLPEYLGSLSPSGPSGCVADPRELPTQFYMEVLTGYHQAGDVVTVSAGNVTDLGTFDIELAEKVRLEVESPNGFSSRGAELFAEDGCIRIKMINPTLSSKNVALFVGVRRENAVVAPGQVFQPKIHNAGQQLVDIYSVPAGGEKVEETIDVSDLSNPPNLLFYNFIFQGLVEDPSPNNEFELTNAVTAWVAGRERHSP